jgi:hypothetical protein
MRKGFAIARLPIEQLPQTELFLTNTGKAAAGGSPASTWARLIRRIFEGDPPALWKMRCPDAHHRPCHGLPVRQQVPRAYSRSSAEASAGHRCSGTCGPGYSRALFPWNGPSRGCRPRRQEPWMEPSSQDPRAVIRKGRKPGGRVVRTHRNPLANLLLHKGKKLPNEARRHGQRENPGLSQGLEKNGFSTEQEMARGLSKPSVRKPSQELRSCSREQEERG